MMGRIRFAIIDAACAVKERLPDGPRRDRLLLACRIARAAANHDCTYGDAPDGAKLEYLWDEGMVYAREGADADQNMALSVAETIWRSAFAMELDPGEPWKADESLADELKRQGYSPAAEFIARKLLRGNTRDWQATRALRDEILARLERRNGGVIWTPEALELDARVQRELAPDR